VPTLALLLIVMASILPEAESPLPDRIGPTVLIEWAGAGAVVGGIISFRSSTPKRDRVIGWCGLTGFVAAAVLYAVALFAQVFSGS
jgi:hypothetical protein